MKTSMPTPMTTDYRNCVAFSITRPRLLLPGQHLRFRAICVTSAPLARLAARRALMDIAGFRRFLPGDLSAIVAPYSKWQHLPRPYFRKINSQYAPFHVLFTHVCITVCRALRANTRDVVGYQQPGVGGLSDYSKPISDPPPHYGDTNQNSTVEVRNGRRRAH
jgi:hypothetical protein